MSIGIFELVNGVLTKKKIAGKTLMDAQLNANSRNGVQNRIITGEINDIKDDISTINTHLSDKAEVKTVTIPAQTTDSMGGVLLTGVPDTAKIVMPEQAGYCFKTSNNHWGMIVRGLNASGAPVTGYALSAFTCNYIE